MKAFKKLEPRQNILSITPYKGGNEKQDDDQNIINLASNESPLGASPVAIAAYKDACSNLHLYPDGASHLLREEISNRYGFDPKKIVCGSGSDELIDILVRSFSGSGDEVLYSEHGFLMYPIAAKSAGATPKKIIETNYKADVESIISSITNSTKIILLANPNNPTGSYLTKYELEFLCKEIPKNVLLVIDAAYAEYVLVDDYDSGFQLVEKYKNVVMTRTFSKLYGLAGLRVGWCYSSVEVSGILNRVRQPFNVNMPAQVAACAALKDIEHENKIRNLNSKCLPMLSDGLKSLGLEVLPSIANFILVRFANSNQAKLIIEYLYSNKILVRDVSPYGLDNYVRITVGTEEHVNILLDLISDFKLNERN
tara:strand:- start:211 stop:1314 length:1104 start_codon:yes stop_codon:yes gene_type:complete